MMCNCFCSYFILNKGLCRVKKEDYAHAMVQVDRGNAAVFPNEMSAGRRHFIFVVFSSRCYSRLQQWALVTL